MLRTVIAAVAACVAAPAAAADWSGFYVGLHAGYGFGEADQEALLSGQWSAEPAGLRNFVSANWTADQEPEGVIYGVHGGYDHELGSGIVAGIEGEYTRLGMEDERATASLPSGFGPSYAFSNRVEVDHQIAARLKLGYDFGPILIYATGGYAFFNVDASASVLSSGGYSKTGSIDKSTHGWVEGIGAEVPLRDHWSAHFLFIHTNFDKFDFATVYNPGSTFTSPAYGENFENDFEVNFLRLGFSYRL